MGGDTLHINYSIHINESIWFGTRSSDMKQIFRAIFPFKTILECWFLRGVSVLDGSPSWCQQCSWVFNVSTFCFHPLPCWTGAQVLAEWYSHCNELDLWPPLSCFPDSLAVSSTRFPQKVIMNKQIFLSTKSARRVCTCEWHFSSPKRIFEIAQYRQLPCPFTNVIQVSFSLS